MFATETAGDLLRSWRRRRGKTHLDVACEADLPTAYLRHLEAGKVTADADTLLHIAECLRLPLRARNAMLVAAGHPPPFPQHGFDTPSMKAAREAVDALLAAHDRNPAVAIDRRWRVLASNSGFSALVAGVEPLILRPPFNLLRLFLHPAGLSIRTVNLAQWRAYLIARLYREVEQDRDPGLAELLDEVQDYPCPDWLMQRPQVDEIAVPLQVATVDGTLTFITATTRFDSAVDVTLSEITIESFLPADRETAEYVRRAASA